MLDFAQFALRAIAQGQQADDHATHWLVRYFQLVLPIDHLAMPRSV